MIIINNKKLHKSIIKKINSLQISQQKFSEIAGISRSMIFRIDKGKKIDIDSFFKLIDNMDLDPNDFLIKKYTNKTGETKSYSMNNYLKLNNDLF